jgi:hypothetical protein
MISGSIMQTIPEPMQGRLRTQPVSSTFAASVVQTVTLIEEKQLHVKALVIFLSLLQFLANQAHAYLTIEFH